MLTQATSLPRIHDRSETLRKTFYALLTGYRRKGEIRRIRREGSTKTSGSTELSSLTPE